MISLMVCFMTIQERTFQIRTRAIESLRHNIGHGKMKTPIIMASFITEGIFRLIRTRISKKMVGEILYSID